jgi:hypothetical protein
MHRVGFEHMTPAFDQAKIVHALDRAATVINTISTLTRATFIFDNSVN